MQPKENAKTVINNPKIEQLKERNRIILEKRSQVLRFYLIENVIPILSEGILNISQELPENPTEFLQKYLEKIAIEQQQKMNEDQNNVL